MAIGLQRTRPLISRTLHTPSHPLFGNQQHPGHGRISWTDQERSVTVNIGIVYRALQPLLVLERSSDLCRWGHPGGSRPIPRVRGPPSAVRIAFRILRKQVIKPWPSSTSRKVLRTTSVCSMEFGWSDSRTSVMGWTIYHIGVNRWGNS